MKRLFFGGMLLVFCAATGQDKKPAFGVRAGLNYGDNGKIELNDVTSTSAEDRIGYHIGVFYRGNLTDNLYLKPELLYTVNNSEHDLRGEKKEYTIKKIDMPILLGVSVLGPIHFFGGPALQYMIKNDLEGIELNDVKNEFTVGVHFGAGLQFNRINFDVRYERGLSKNKAASIDEDIRVDSRPDQFIIGVAIDL
ncbi:porin family protein [Aquimarina sp. 2201CG1-2-11]|uniref:porin family protein n=1 Tax=Aquimarina discodermiae TaxID=3231043 RepID=UPI0034620AB6